MSRSRSIMPCYVEWEITGSASRDQFIASEAVATMLDWHSLPVDRIDQHVCELAARHLGDDWISWVVESLVSRTVFYRVGGEA
jgi:hypothetical protein